MTAATTGWIKCAGCHPTFQLSPDKTACMAKVATSSGNRPEFRSPCRIIRTRMRQRKRAMTNGSGMEGMNDHYHQSMLHRILFLQSASGFRFVACSRSSACDLHETFAKQHNRQCSLSGNHCCCRRGAVHAPGTKSRLTAPASSHPQSGQALNGLMNSHADIIPQHDSAPQRDDSIYPDLTTSD